MPYVTPRTWVAGAVLTAAQLNQDVRDNVAFLANPPACRVYHNTTQTVATATNTQMLLNSERYDTDTMHSTASLTNRITFNTAGLYLVTGTVRWAATNNNTTGVREIGIILNGGAYLAITDIPGQASVQIMSIATVYKFIVGDFIALDTMQTSGNTLTVDSSANYSPEFSATWLGLG